MAKLCRYVFFFFSLMGYWTYTGTELIDNFIALLKKTFILV